MKILVQTNKRPEHQLNHEFKKLKESGYEIVPFGYTVNEDSSLHFTGLEETNLNEPHIVRANIYLIRALCINKVEANLPLIQTIDYDPIKFNTLYNPSSNIFLNHNPLHSTHVELKKIIDRRVDEDIFIKPCDDLKLLPGTIVKNGFTLREVLESKNQYCNFTEKELEYPVLISTLIRELNEEVRCYVVNKKVVAISRYRLYGEYNTDKIFRKEGEAFLEFAKIAIDVHAPGDNFTIDLCRDSNGHLHVVEYNCLTASSLYECNSKALFDALFQYYY